jgi:hypothetical protein
MLIMTKATKYLIVLLVLTSSLFIFLSITSGIMGRESYGLRSSWQKMRKVDKHFFFDLLPSFDLNRATRANYSSSTLLPPSAFGDIMDRVLFTRYLVDRFAYASFVQLGCDREHVDQLLPETSVKVRVSVDPNCGTLRTNQELYLNASALAKRSFDLVLIEPEFVTLRIVQAALPLLNPGGALILADTNSLRFRNNETHEIPFADARNLGVLISLRGSEDLDVATLDVDGGISIVYRRRNSAPLDADEVAASLVAGDKNKQSAKGDSASSSTAITMLGRGSTSDGANTESATPRETRPDKVYTDVATNNKILNLMRFEDVHEWLAPTGNVDSVTAFGGEKALTVFRESEEFEKKCARLAQDPLKQDLALRCLQGECIFLPT